MSEYGGQDEIELTLHPEDLLDDDENRADRNQRCHIKTQKVVLSDTAHVITNPSPSPENPKSSSTTLKVETNTSKTAVINENKPVPDAAKIDQSPAKPAPVKKVPPRITAPDSSPVKFTTVKTKAALHSVETPSTNPESGDVNPVSAIGPNMLSNPDMVRVESQELGVQIWANCEALTEFAKLLSPSEQLLPYAKSLCMKLTELNDKLYSLR